MVKNEVDLNQMVDLWIDINTNQVVAVLEAKKDTIRVLMHMKDGVIMQTQQVSMNRDMHISYLYYGFSNSIRKIKLRNHM